MTIPGGGLRISDVSDASEILKRLCFLSFLIATAVVLLLLAGSRAHATDPLPSWNDTASRKEIIALVEKVTNESSPD